MKSTVTCYDVRLPSAPSSPPTDHPRGLHAPPPALIRTSSALLIGTNVLIILFVVFSSRQKGKKRANQASTVQAIEGSNSASGTGPRADRRGSSFGRKAVGQQGISLVRALSRAQSKVSPQSTGAPPEPRTKNQIITEGETDTFARYTVPKWALKEAEVIGLTKLGWKLELRKGDSLLETIDLCAKPRYL